MLQLVASVGARNRNLTGLLASILVFAAACGGAYSSQEAVAEEFIRAAVEGESLTELVEGSQPLEWVDAVRRTDPMLLPGVSTDLEVKFGDERDGVTTVEFLLRTSEHEESLGMQFVPRDGVWRIVQVQLSDRF